MLHHCFDFVPLGRQSGWTIDDEGEPRIWWKARLSNNDRIYLSDGSDAREREVVVSVKIGAQTPVGKTLYTGGSEPAAKWGYFATGKDSDTLKVFVAVSQQNFDRLLSSIRSAAPPTLTVGFGPPEPFQQLTGAITMDTSGAYRWDNAAEQAVVIEACEFSQSQINVPTDAPEAPEELPAAVRGLSIVFTVLTNLVAIAIAAAAFGAANGKFETTAVSLLLLIYVVIINNWTQLREAIARTELSALSKFFQLRTLAGVPSKPEETQYLSKVQERLDEPGVKHWINLSGSTIIGLMAMYKLIRLLF